LVLVDAGERIRQVKGWLCRAAPDLLPQIAELKVETARLETIPVDYMSTKEDPHPVFGGAITNLIAHPPTPICGALRR
jgi:hypothetical protein